MNILTNKENVEELLKLKEHLRDNDTKLIANLWAREIGIEKSKQMTAYDFLEKFSKGELAHPESVMRIRRKLQEEFPELRGKKWEARHKKQDSVKKQLYETPELYQGGTP